MWLPKLQSIAKNKIDHKEPCIGHMWNQNQPSIFAHDKIEHEKNQSWKKSTSNKLTTKNLTMKVQKNLSQ
jgi:hypothetical protein